MHTGLKLVPPADAIPKQSCSFTVTYHILITRLTFWQTLYSASIHSPVSPPIKPTISYTPFITDALVTREGGHPEFSTKKNALRLSVSFYAFVWHEEAFKKVIEITTCLPFWLVTSKCNTTSLDWSLQEPHHLLGKCSDWGGSLAIPLHCCAKFNKRDKSTFKFLNSVFFSKGTKNLF